MIVKPDNNKPCMYGESGETGERHVHESFPVAMSRKESCLLLSVTLRPFCVLCLRQSMPSTPVSACTSLQLRSAARKEDEMTAQFDWMAISYPCEKTEGLTQGYPEEVGEMKLGGE